MSNKKEYTYEDIKRNLSEAEIVDSFVFRGTLSGTEKEEAEEAFKLLRLERLKEMSDDQILRGELVRMKLLMKDYFLQNDFLVAFSFATQLKKYANLLNKPMQALALDLGIHKTKLSRIINHKENPNIDLMYRLERHSGEIIPATYWFRLHSKKLEDGIKQNMEKRQLEYDKVKNELNFKKSA